MSEDDIALLLQPLAPRSAQTHREYDVLKTRLDVAWLTKDMLHGLEIKTSASRLTRLSSQVPVYSRFCTHCSLVTVPDHMARGREIVPDWWGLIMVSPEAGDDRRSVEVIRTAEASPDFSPSALALRLWKSEMMDVLRRLGELRGVKSKTFREQHQRLVETFDEEAVRTITLATLYIRGHSPPPR